ncbi:MAG: hypothetical protein WHS65_13020 [Melioribacteraceae bacterium]
MRTIVAILSLMTLVMSSNAQNLNGKWKGSFSGPCGDMGLSYTFKVVADSLTGSVTSMMGTLPIVGKVDGKKFSFTVDVNGQTFTDTGILEGDSILLQSPLMEKPIVLKRVPEESKINGKWLGKVSGPQGEFEITFVFKVDGNKLIGKNSTAMGENDLTNGIVNGNEFSFDVNMGDMKINHKCKYLENHTIDMKVDFMGQDILMKLTRATN